MKPRNLAWMIPLFLVCWLSSAVAQETMYVTSEGTKLKEDKKASSKTVVGLPLGAELSVMEKDDKWYRVKTSEGQKGWVYRGRVSDTPPSAEVKREGADLFAALGGSGIKADEADTARSMRGLSKETEKYASMKETPEKYRKALDQVLAVKVTQQEVTSFLRDGKVGEYAE